MLGDDGVHELSNSAHVGREDMTLIFLSINHFVAGIWKPVAGVKFGHLSLPLSSHLPPLVRDCARLRLVKS